MPPYDQPLLPLSTNSRSVPPWAQNVDPNIFLDSPEGPSPTMRDALGRMAQEARDRNSTDFTMPGRVPAIRNSTDFTMPGRVPAITQNTPGSNPPPLGSNLGSKWEFIPNKPFLRTLGGLFSGGLAGDLTNRVMNRLDPEIGSESEANLRGLVTMMASTAGPFLVRNPWTLGALALADLGMAGLDYLSPVETRSGSGQVYERKSDPWWESIPQKHSGFPGAASTTGYEYSDDDVLRLVSKTLNNLDSGYRRNKYDSDTVRREIGSLSSRLGREQQGHRAYRPNEIDSLFREAANTLSSHERSGTDYSRNMRPDAFKKSYQDWGNSNP